MDKMIVGRTEKTGSSKARAVSEYLLIIALYYITGSAFSYTRYSTQITVFFLVTLCACLLTKSYHYALRRRVLIPFVTMSFFVLLVPLLFSDSIPTYIAIIMQLASGLFCAAIISPESFKQKYTNVIMVFAAISLVGYAIGLLRPSFALNFPVTIGDASVDYYNAGVYVFMRAKGYGSLVLMQRNAGICWEPGCYQTFLNIALLFLLDEQQKRPQKRFYLKFILLFITIVTTISTTGIIILMLLLVIYFRVLTRELGRKWLFLPLVLAVSIAVYYLTPVREILLAKLGREFGTERTFWQRISLNRLKYLFSDSGIPYVFGMSFSKWLTHGVSLWNSVIHSILCLGIPFTMIHIRGYWKGSNFLVAKKGVLFLVMILCASSETLFWRVFFNTIAFYGWIGYREQDREESDEICAY